MYIDLSVFNKKERIFVPPINRELSRLPATGTKDSLEYFYYNFSVHYEDSREFYYFGSLEPKRLIAQSSMVEYLPYTNHIRVKSIHSDSITVFESRFENSMATDVPNQKIGIVMSIAMESVPFLQLWFLIG